MVLNIHFFSNEALLYRSEIRAYPDRKLVGLGGSWSVQVSALDLKPFEMLFCSEQIIPNYTLQNYSSFSWKVIIRKKLYDVDMSH